MTIRELKEKLNELPDNLVVVQCHNNEGWNLLVDFWEVAVADKYVLSDTGIPIGTKLLIMQFE